MARILDSLDDVKKHFVNDDTPTAKSSKNYNDRESLEKHIYASNNELIRRNEIVVRLLTKVATVVSVLEEVKIIQKLLTEASPYVHMRSVGDCIRLARKNLVLASRAKTWKKSKSKSQHIDNSTLKKYIDGFTEQINTAVLELNKDTAKRRGSYFNNLKATVFEDLPYDLSKNKKTTIKTAPLLVFIKENSKIKGKQVEQIQDNLYLIKDARLLGVSRSAKLSKTAIDRIALQKSGCTLFPRSIPRAGTIEWYLLLDFNVEVLSASFVSSMKIHDAGSIEPGATLEQFTKLVTKQQEQRVRTAMHVQRSVRKMFEEEERDYYATLRYYRGLEEVYAEALSYWKTEFAQLTSFDGSAETGLHVSQYDKLDSFFDKFLEKKMSEPGADNKLRLRILQDRVDARYAYYCHNGVRRKLKDIRGRISAIEKDLVERKAALAQQVTGRQMTKMINTELEQEAA